MILRSLPYSWTKEDRLTRARWAGAVCVFYACLALLLFSAFAISNTSMFGSNTTADRLIAAAVSSGAPVVATATSRQRSRFEQAPA